MNPDEFMKTRQLFDAAIELPEGERRAWLEAACGNDATLLEKVERLLGLADRATADALPKSPDQATVTAADPRPGEGLGTAIGPYKLLQLIGEGGFGSVYMAAQERPVRRQVALKIIKLGMDTRQVIARFEAERQALAMMDHPNIARVLDAGATEAGRPYFVMELVRGIPLLDYCDQHNLSTAERLQLFISICHAIQHAHQKGIIHRDLKPSNVMVTLHDGRPVPKVIDFGIAKATSQRLTEKTLFTEYRQFIGTPEYMSPEQAEMSGLDVDTRADIYSLGVLLYELLTGTTPFDPRTLREGGFGEIQRIIREEEPVKPSTRLSVLIEEEGTRGRRAQANGRHDDSSSMSAIARHRRSDPASLCRLVRGDLDWIVMKAIEKDRTRRYETAAELARDIERHLADQPVLAGPPRVSYRLWKFWRRNRLPLAAALAVIVVSVAAAISMTLLAVGAQRARGEAETARGLAEEALDREREQREAAEAARVAETAQRERAVASEAETRHAAAEAEAVTAFLVEMLSMARSDVVLSPDMTVRAMLDHASDEVRRAFAHQPAAEAAVRTTIGRAYYSLGEPDLAAPHLRRALEIRDDLDATPAELYETLWPLTGTLYELSDPESNPMGRRATMVGLQVISQGHPELGQTLGRLVESVINGRQELAAQLFREAGRLARIALDTGDPRWLIVADCFFVDGLIATFFRADPAAEGYFGAALEIQRRELPETHPAIANTIEVMVAMLTGQGRFGEAEALVRESIDLRKRVLPPGHWWIASSEAQLGGCLAGQGLFEEAENLLQSSYQVILDARGAGATSYILIGLVHLYDVWDKPDRAAEYRAKLVDTLADAQFQGAWPITQVAFGPEHAELAKLLEQAQAIGQTGGGARPSMDFRPALGGGQGVASGAGPTSAEEQLQELFDRIFALRRKELPDDHPLAALVARQVAFWADQWRSGVSVELRRTMVAESLVVLRHWQDELPTDTATALFNLARFELRSGNATVAETLSREAWTILSRGVGEGSWLTGYARLLIGMSLVAQERFAEAEPHLVSAHENFLDELGETSDDVGRARRELVQLYRQWGREEQARPYVEMTLDYLRRRAGIPGAAASSINDYAWELLTVEPEVFRDPAAALPVARRAVEISGGREAAILDTLALALHLTGDTAAALATERRALQVLPPGESSLRTEIETRLREFEQAAP